MVGFQSMLIIDQKNILKFFENFNSLAFHFLFRSCLSTLGSNLRCSQLSSALLLRRGSAPATLTNLQETGSLSTVDSNKGQLISQAIFCGFPDAKSKIPTRFFTFSGPSPKFRGFFNVFLLKIYLI